MELASVSTLRNKDVAIKSGDNVFNGRVGIIEENGIWITLAPGCPIPHGAPSSVHLKMFFPFAQMQWLAFAPR